MLQLLSQLKTHLFVSRTDKENRDIESPPMSRQRLSRASRTCSTGSWWSLEPAETEGVSVPGTTLFTSAQPHLTKGTHESRR